MTFHERTQQATRLTTWPVSIDATYIYTAGVAGERFFTALRDDGKILATRCRACDVEYLPPRIFCERCFADVSDTWHEVAPEGTVAAITVVRRDLDGRALPKPEVRALVRLGKGTGGIIHRVLAEPGRVAVGARVRAKLKPRAERKGNILDIAGFEPVV